MIKEKIKTKNNDNENGSTKKNISYVEYMPHAEVASEKKEFCEKETKQRGQSIFKWGDIIILTIVILALFLSIYFLLKPQGEIVEIYLDGKLFESAPLSRDAEIDIDGHNKVKIENGRVYMSFSDCGGQDCVETGSIARDGGMIVCLPNKVVVKIVSKDVDAVT